jgi:hypothetical protein
MSDKQVIELLRMALITIHDEYDYNLDDSYVVTSMASIAHEALNITREYAKKSKNLSVVNGYDAWQSYSDKYIKEKLKAENGKET